MKNFFWLAIVIVNLCGEPEMSCAFAASASPSLSKAKQKAEAKGFIFLNSKDDIVAKAKEESKLEALTFLEGNAKKTMIEVFRKKYPFIQVVGEEIGGTDEYQRFILEMKAGRAKRWDTVHRARAKGGQRF